MTAPAAATQTPAAPLGKLRKALGAAGLLPAADPQNPPDFSDNARTVMQRRYLAKDRKGTILEDPEGMLRRVADNLAQAEKNYSDDPAAVSRASDKFYTLMRSLDFLPNSPTLMNAGRELQQLSACFVLPVDDSLQSIFEGVRQTALIHKSGGGTGFSFSRLRPEGDIVGATGGIASGPVSFIGAFDSATEVVKQGGTRRGANMAILNADHPDIMSFINVKANGDKLNNFNISVGVTEDFMQRAEAGQDYDLVNPRSGAVVGRLNAGEVFNQLVRMAWQTGDPGIVFLDRINRDNPNPQLGRIESTNPCGEQPLLPYESCNLGSVNLANMVKPGKSRKEPLQVDYQRLERAVHAGVHLLDNVIDMNNYPLQQIADMSRRTRRIGIGVMGFADLLITLGIPYDTKAAIDLAGDVMAKLQEATYAASAKLAVDRGCFPEWERSVYNRKGHRRPMRNSAPVTIAPTGTISIIANASSGIEPLFALSYVRNVMDNTKLYEGNPRFTAVAKELGFYSEELMADLARTGTLEGIDPRHNVPDWVKEVFRTSHDISPEWHVRMQATFQLYTDNSVSKTINFPAEATVQDVADAYNLAWQKSCKGITIYRDGSKDNQVLSSGPSQADITAPANGGVQDAAGLEPAELAQPIDAPRNGHDPETEPMPGSVDSRQESLLPASVDPAAQVTSRVVRERPKEIQGTTERVRTGHGTLYVTVNCCEPNQPFEIFTALGKAGGCDSAQLEAISRLCSLALRSGVSPAKIVSQLQGITCCPAWNQGSLVRSAPDAVALVLSRYIDSQSEDGGAAGGGQAYPEVVTDHAPPMAAAGGRRCPDCNGFTYNLEGCQTCYSCGWSRCE